MNKNIKLSELQVNNGCIPGLPKNPRFIKDHRFKQLVKSIEDDPEMLSLRELIVYPFKGKFVIICGNMRYRAMIELGYKEAPCKVLPQEVTVDKLRAYTIKDNVEKGNWNEDELSNEWDETELESFGYEIPKPIDSPPKSRCVCPECGKDHSKAESK